MKEQERSAIEAVARRFSATWEKRDYATGDYLTIAGKRVAVDITTLKRRGSGKDKTRKPHLRFDKVVIRILERLRSAFAETVPGGTTVLLTVTAPIRLPSKTAESLEEKIRILLRRRSLRQDEKGTIHGNRVRIRISKGGSERAPKVIGFVHNPDSDPLLLLNMTNELLELNIFEAKRQAPKPEGDRWLVVINAGESSSLEAYRYIYAQLRIPTDFNKILMVFGDGHVGTLLG